MSRSHAIPFGRALRLSVSAVAFALAAPLALAQQAGSTAPAFTLTDTAGKSVSLADYKGKYVVLEWTNPECPFVQSHYSAKAMQDLQKTWGAKDVVWLTINSTNQSHPEYKTAAQMSAWEKAQGAAQKHVLIDGTSATGRAYAAKTTPQMFVVDPSGKVIYDGAADAHRSANPASHKASDSYVQVALNEAMAGKPVTTASTSPYGCSVKY